MRKNVYLIMVGLTVAILTLTGEATNEVFKLGMPETGWTESGFSTMNDSNDVNSMRFTALQDVTVDKVFMSLRYMDSADTRMRIGIQGDNNGVPSGTWLNSTVMDPGAPGDFLGFIEFGSVPLTNGSVYHVVTEFDTITTEDFRIYSSLEEHDIRPFDRQSDTNFTVLKSADGGATWSDYHRDPIFVLANGGSSSTNIVQGPGNPYNIGRYNFGSRGDAMSVGIKWQFASFEADGNESVNVTNINLKIDAAGSPTNNLIVHIRELDGTILASATVPTNLTEVTWVSYPLDNHIILNADTPYLITTEFEDQGGTSSQYYRLAAVNTFNNNLIANASYGGTNNVVPISSYNYWDTWNNSLYRAWDISFWFDVTGADLPDGTMLIIE